MRIFFSLATLKVLCVAVEPSSVWEWELNLRLTELRLCVGEDCAFIWMCDMVLMITRDISVSQEKSMQDSLKSPIDTTNYRPISKLPFIAKVFEKSVCQEAWMCIVFLTIFSHSCCRFQSVERALVKMSKTSWCMVMQELRYAGSQCSKILMYGGSGWVYPGRTPVTLTQFPLKSFSKLEEHYYSK